MAESKAGRRYGKKDEPVRGEREAEETARKTAGKEGAPSRREMKIGSDRGPAKKPEEGHYEEGSEEMAEHETHARHEHEHMAMHHRHMMEHNERHHRHAMERHAMRGASHEEREKMHDRHEKERQHTHTRHENEHRQMHERHEMELAAPGEEAAERKPTDRPLSLMAGGKK